MTPNHIPASDAYPGLIRFTTDDGRTFTALGDPKKHASKVSKMIGELETPPAFEGRE